MVAPRRSTPRGKTATHKTYRKLDSQSVALSHHQEGVWKKLSACMKKRDELEGKLAEVNAEIERLSIEHEKNRQKHILMDYRYYHNLERPTVEQRKKRYGF